MGYILKLKFKNSILVKAKIDGGSIEDEESGDEEINDIPNDILETDNGI